MRKTLERSSSSEEDEEGEEPLDSSRVIRHERIIKKIKRHTHTKIFCLSIIFNVRSPFLLLSFSFVFFFTKIIIKFHQFWSFFFIFLISQFDKFLYSVGPDFIGCDLLLAHSLKCFTA